jgi:two-component system repressor protein LuxO
MRLARYFLEKISDEEGKNFQAFSPEAENILTAYRWPGNVRELENTIRRIVVLGKGKTVEPSMLSILQEHAKPAPEIPPGNANIGIQPYLPRTPGEIKPLKVYEREAIMAALSACNGNITEASKRLDINPATIHRKQKQWKQDGA